MTTNLELTGTYRAHGNKLVNPDKSFTLVVCTRNHTGNGKPGQFIVAKTATGNPWPGGKKEQYISSLYPVPGQPFTRIEYQGVQFVFEYQATGAVIREMAMNNNSHL